MKTYILPIIVSILVLNSIYAQNETIQFGNKGFDGIYDIKIDHLNNKYITGFFQDNIKKNKSKGDTDIFTAKINSNNELIWFKQLGSSYHAEKEITEFGKFLELDSKNNIYVLGKFYNEILLEDLTSLKAHGKQDIFLAKYDINGNQIWVKTFGTYNNDNVYKLIIDKEDNIYIIAKLGITKSDRSPKNVIYKINKTGAIDWSKEIFTNDTKLSKIEKVVFIDDKISILIKSPNSSSIKTFDLNGLILNSQELNSENTIVSFAIHTNSIYLLEVNKNNNYKYYLKKINSNGVVDWLKTYKESVLFKPTNITIGLKNILVFGRTNKSIDNSKINQFTLDGHFIKDYSFASTNQNKVTNYYINKEHITLCGFYYNNITINNDSKKRSKGMTDGFIKTMSILNNTGTKSLDNLVLISPNPNNGNFMIKNHEYVEKIEILDVIGKIVYEEKIISSKISISNIVDGTYYIRAYLKNDEIEIIKIIINHHK